MRFFVSQSKGAAGARPFFVGKKSQRPESEPVDRKKPNPGSEL